MLRLGYLTSHPIQYQAPLFRRLAKAPDVHLEVLFNTEHGIRPTHDAGFGQTVQWDTPLLEGYKHRFLVNRSPTPGLAFWGQFNPGIVKLVSAGHLDALVVHGYYGLTHFLALMGPRSRGTRILMRGESHLLKTRSAFKEAWRAPIISRLFRNVDQFLAIGSLNRDYYRSFGVEDNRITVAPYSVDNERFCSPTARCSRDAIRGELGVPRNGVLFLVCGKLIQQKRPLDPVRALARVPPRARSTVAFVGAGVLEAAIREEGRRLGVDGQLRFLGFRNQSELPGIYAAGDALILASGDEPWGLVVNEAMAAGLAIAVSDRVGAGPDLVRQNGSVFPVGDIDSLGTIMSRWASDPAEVRRLGEESRRAISSWGIEETAEGILEGVRASLSRPGRR